jgi:hypothetical protein
MFSFTYNIDSIKLNDKLPFNQIVFPEETARLWKINSSIPGKATYHFLSKEIEVSTSAELSPGTVQLHSRLASELSLSPGEKIRCLYRKKENVFQFGPSLGVVLGDCSEVNEMPFGDLTHYLTEMAKTCERLYCPFTVFSYKETSGSYTEGFKYIEGKWEKSLTPLPQVIYNRIGRRDQEKSVQCKHFFQRLTELNIPYFNERFLHKWEVYNYLLNEPVLSPYLPETKHLKSLADLEQMAEKHSGLYIKPFTGREGSGIIKVSADNGIYFITYPADEGWQTKKVSSLKQLYSMLKGRIMRRPYIIQPMISVNEKYKAPVDFRVLCIKDSYSIWKACSAVARVGQKNTIVSNLAKGGSQKQALSILEEIIPSADVPHTERLMHELSLLCAYVLDRETEGIYGELGIDLMIDNEGRPWILEVNIKPSKSELPEAAVSLPSVNLIILYAVSLAGFAD